MCETPPQPELGLEEVSKGAGMTQEATVGPGCCSVPQALGHDNHGASPAALRAGRGTVTSAAVTGEPTWCSLSSPEVWERGCSTSCSHGRVHKAHMVHP